MGLRSRTSDPSCRASSQGPLRPRISELDADSAHALFAQQIDLLGLAPLYGVQEKADPRPERDRVHLQGTRHNVASVKSTEASTLLGRGSSNRLEDVLGRAGADHPQGGLGDLDQLQHGAGGGQTYQRFVKKPPTGSRVVKIGWEDNPGSRGASTGGLGPEGPRSGGLRDGLGRQLQAGPRRRIYANEILAATRTNRFTRVPHDPSKPVLTFWDLGRAT